MTDADEESGYLTGKLLIAMPTMPDARFARSVIYVCAHNADGAMGLVLNRLVNALSFNDLLQQLEIEAPPVHPDLRIHFGGPVEGGRGFVLHSADFQREGTVVINDEVALTATIDILRAIAGGHGPRHCLLALGYTGWAAGQLDAEMQANGWLHAPADENLLFDAALDSKWERSISKLGVTLSTLSGEAGHA